MNDTFLLDEFKQDDAEIHGNILRIGKIHSLFKEAHVQNKASCKVLHNKLVSVISAMKCERIQANLYLFFKWGPTWGLVLWLAWIDDKLCIAHADRVEGEKNMLMEHFK